MIDLIDRQQAIDAIEEYADRLQMVNWEENPGVPYKAYALNWCINTIRDLPSAQPEKRTDKRTETHSCDCISRQAAIEAMEKVSCVFRELGLSCAYDMPSFWYNNGKDYKVILTKYHKGYMQALNDAEGKIKKILEGLCYE